MTDDILTAAVRHFLWYVESVFHDDWEFSRERMQEGYIDDDGTFLSPGVKDESNNWGNRGGLLKEYRHLRAILDTADSRSALEGKERGRG